MKKLMSRLTFNSKVNQGFAMKKLIAVLTLNLAVAVPSFAQPNPERDAYFGETHLFVAELAVSNFHSNGAISSNNRTTKMKAEYQRK